MIYLKSDREIEKMRKSAQLVSHTLAEVSKYIEPGIETGKLDVIAEDFVKKHGARPAFKGYGPASNPFPGTLCISVNEEVQNNSGVKVNLFHYSQISRKNKPLVQNFYILHEGLLGVVDEQLKEETYDDVIKDKKKYQGSAGCCGAEHRSGALGGWG